MSIDHLAQLKTLRLYGMSEAWSEIQAEAPQRKKPLSSGVLLSRLIEAEIADRKARSLRYQLKVAKFPIHRSFTEFNWQESVLSESQMQVFAGAGFMEEAHNLILVGGTGTGKTHLATAIGNAAIHEGKRVRFFNAVDLVNQLQLEKQMDKTGSLARK